MSSQREKKRRNGSRGTHEELTSRLMTKLINEERDVTTMNQE